MKNQCKLFLELYVVGFFAGIILTNVYLKDIVFGGFMNLRQELLQYTKTNLRTISYLLYLLQIRFIPAILLLLIKKSKAKKVIIILVILWVGLLFGVLYASFALKFGVKGILLITVALMPQMLLYFFAYLIILNDVFNHITIKQSFHKSITVLLALSMGVALEYYMNPFLVKLILNAL